MKSTFACQQTKVPKCHLRVSQRYEGPPPDSRIVCAWRALTRYTSLANIALKISWIFFVTFQHLNSSSYMCVSMELKGSLKPRP